MRLPGHALSHGRPERPITVLGVQGGHALSHGRPERPITVLGVQGQGNSGGQYSRLGAERGRRKPTFFVPYRCVPCVPRLPRGVFLPYYQVRKPLLPFQRAEPAPAPVRPSS